LAPPPTATPYPTPEYLVLAAGDYDGDGISDIAVFRPDTGLWAVRGLERTHFGTAEDVPVGGDYDEDGIADVSTFRASSGLWAVKQLTRSPVSTSVVQMTSRSRATTTATASAISPSSGRHPAAGPCGI